jgi:hypothetical protein
VLRKSLLLPLFVALLVFSTGISTVRSDILPRAACQFSKEVYEIGEPIVVYISSMGVLSQPVLVIGKPDGSTSTISLGEQVAGDFVPIAFSIGAAGPPPGYRQAVLYTYFGIPGHQDYVEVARCGYQVQGGPADLVLERVWVSPRNPHQEDMVSLSAEIANMGGTDAYGFRFDIYLDGSLWDTGSVSLPAGSSTTFTSNRQYQAEDGSHDVRGVVNSDRSVQESNYGNNEGSASFFVSPRTVTETVTVTKTSTRTQTQRTTETVTSTLTMTATRTTDTTALQTITANPVTVMQTLTGLVTTTVCSPTVTIAVTTSAQIISNPLLWMVLSTLTMIGAVFQIPHSGRLRTFCRRFVAFFPLAEFCAWLTKRQVRKGLFAVCLISVTVLSITLQAGQEAYGSAVTTTRSVTSTEWTTLTQSLTSTRYVTSKTTETWTSVNTKTSLVTVTRSTTMIIDQRSTSTVFVATTTTVTFTKTSGQTEIIRWIDSMERFASVEIREGKSVWCGHLAVANMINYHLGRAAITPQDVISKVWLGDRMLTSHDIVSALNSFSTDYQMGKHAQSRGFDMNVVIEEIDSDRPVILQTWFGDWPWAEHCSVGGFWGHTSVVLAYDITKSSDGQIVKASVNTYDCGWIDTSNLGTGPELITFN